MRGCTYRPDLGVGGELYRDAVDGEKQALQACELRELEAQQAGVVVEHCARGSLVVLQCICRCMRMRRLE